MNLEHKKSQLSILLLLSMVLFVGSYIILTQEIEEIEGFVATKASERANAIKEKLVLTQAIINSLEATVQQQIALHNASLWLHPALAKITDFPELDVYGINERPQGTPFSPDGALNGIGTFSNTTLEEKLEISAALALKPVFQSAFKALPDLVWVYYISSKEFIYSAPFIDIESFNLNSQIYQRDYWLNAIPANNPDKKLVMTELYADGAGAGYLTTLSKPVYFEDNFRGIIAIDIAMNSYRDLLLSNTVIGNSFLMDENSQVLTSDVPTSINKHIYIPNFNDSNNLLPVHDENGNDYFIFDILEDEVYLVHRLDRDVKYTEALVNSVRELILLLASIVMGYMIIYFRFLINKVGELANIDPLTGLLNRRAMENAVMPVLSLSKRYKYQCCFILADIDHFKKINDQYGHHAGDEVLVNVTSVIKSCLRESDMISRHGGEEFLVVLPQTDLESGQLLAERIRTSVENTRTTNERIATTLSLGCVEFNLEENYDGAISRADKMLYRAKANGRNRTEIDESQALLEHQVQLAT
jgi:diguanylate cyclase